MKKIANSCIVCKKIQGRCGEQLMAPLPKERVQACKSPFTNTGIDFFGPFRVTRGRAKAQEKRYGVVFSCLASRACHFEIAHSMNVDSFVNALRRFVSRRGRVKKFFSDNGTNIVGKSKEFINSIKMEQK